MKENAFWKFSQIGKTCHFQQSKLLLSKDFMCKSRFEDIRVVGKISKAGQVWNDSSKVGVNQLNDISNYAFSILRNNESEQKSKSDKKESYVLFWL